MKNPIKKIYREIRNRLNRYPLNFEQMGALMFGKGSWRTNRSMRLSTVYRCVACISDSIAQLPLEVFSVDSRGYKTKQRHHPLFRLLNVKPNARMTRYIFIQRLVESILLDGNFFAYIVRDDSGRPRQLIYIPAGYVTINYPPTLEEPVSYTVSGEGTEGKWHIDIKSADMIHVVNRTDDGVTGISVLTYAAQTLGLAHAAEQHASNFFSSGCGVGGILKSMTRLSDEQKKEIKKSWDAVFSKEGSNGVAVLGADLVYQPVTVNAKDAQLLETRAFNVIDICRFFGVSPVKAFDLSKSSYSTVEATNIGFLTDTISPLLEKIELEFETKLLKEGDNIDLRFDVKQLLRADKQSQATYYSTMFQIGAIAPNEIRLEMDLPPVEGGDNNFVQVNLQTLEKAVAASSETDGGEGAEQI